MPNFVLDVPEQTGDQTPQVNTQRVTHLDLIAQPTLSLAMSVAKHVNIDNRLARTIFCSLDTTGQTQALGYYIDPNSELTLSPVGFSFMGLTIVDVYQNPLGNTQGITLGLLSGGRNDEQFPYRLATAGSNTLGGQVLITTSSLPIGIMRNNRTAPIKANWAQQITAAGVGTLSIQASNSLASPLNNVSAGLFNLLTFINAQASSFVATIYPIGAAQTVGQSFAITIPANTPLLTIPIECEFVSCAFTVAGQSLIGYQAVVNHTANEA